MLTSSPAYKLARMWTNKRVFTFDVRTLDGELLARDVPILGGDVSASATSRVTRTAQFNVADDWFPRTPTDTLSPYHAIVSIKAGVGYPDGTEELFPIFTGRVYNIKRNADGSVTCRADDLAADVIAAQFENPRNSQRGGSVIAEIRSLIREALPMATFGPDDAVDAKVPDLTWDEDRGKAIDDLAAAVGARWYCLGDGSFVVRRYPYITDAVQLDITDGPDGVLVGADQDVTADGTANSVVVISERTDGSAPIRVIERNDVASSPARYGGPFGKRVQTITMQTPVTLYEAQIIAIEQLAALSALSEQWTAAMVPDMTIEPADVVRFEWRGIQSVQVVDSVSYPLTPDATMNLGTRSNVGE